MKATRKQAKKAKEPTIGILPLVCSTFGKQSEIDIQVDARKKWQTIATVYSVEHLDAEDCACEIISALRLFPQSQKRLNDLTAFLNGLIDKNELPEKEKRKAQELISPVGLSGQKNGKG